MKNRRVAPLVGIALALILAMAAPAGAQLADTLPWPMFQHDLRHTGRSALPGPAALQLKWTYTPIAWVKTQTAVGDGVLYFGSGHQPMCSVEAATGAERWCLVGGGDANQSSPAIDKNDRIYEGARDNKLWAVNSDGSVEWADKIPLDGDIFSSPAVGPDGTIYTACGCLSAGILHAFRPDGVLKWKIKLGRSSIRNSSPAVVQEPTGTFIYIGSVDGWLRKVKDNGTSAALQWEARVGKILRNSSPTVGADGTVYIGSDAGFFAVSSAGVRQWQLVTRGAVDTTAAIDSNGRLYVSSYLTGKRTLYSIDPATGQPVWTRIGTGGTTSDYSQTPSAVIDSQDRIYAAIGKTVLKLDTAGNQLDSYLVTADVIALSLGDGVLYVSIKDNKLHALGP